MNKRGSAFFYTFMLGITIFVLALALGPAVSFFTNTAIGPTVGDTIGLDCENTESNFVKATCVVTDISLLYFIGTLILIAFVVVKAKVAVGGVE